MNEMMNHLHSRRPQDLHFNPRMLRKNHFKMIIGVESIITGCSLQNLGLAINMYLKRNRPANTVPINGSESDSDHPFLND